MKNEDIYDALSGIDEKYIERSEDFDDIKNQFRREKARKTGIFFSLCGSFVIIASSVFVVNGGFLKNAPYNPEEESEIIMTETHTTENIPTTTTAFQSNSVTEKIKTTAVTYIEKTEITEIVSSIVTEVTEDFYDDTTVCNPYEETVPYIEETTHEEEYKKGLPDNDSLEEILIFGDNKYCEFYDDTENLNIGDFIGTVENFHAGDYLYLEPSDEVYTVLENEEFLIVKKLYGDLLYFRIED